MSITQIESKYFSTLSDIQASTDTTDTVGDFARVWNTVSADVPASVQPVRMTEAKILIQGKEYTLDMKAYIPSRIEPAPLPGQRFIDKETGLVYGIVSVLKFQASRVDIAIGHHYKLLLQITRSEHG